MKRMILELGGFYLKVGQVFATKSDLLPPQYVAALKSVFDDCPPVPASKIDSILRKEFGNKPVSAVFKSFDTSALASATIAQVHVAHVDVDGKDTKVAVKVQNPGSERLMRMDMANMLFVSTFMDSLRVSLPFDHTSILKEYRTQVPLEFDFKRESAMLTLIGDAIHGKVPDVETPRVIPGLCTKRVVTVSIFIHFRISFYFRVGDVTDGVFCLWLTPLADVVCGGRVARDDHPARVDRVRHVLRVRFLPEGGVRDEDAHGQYRGRNRAHRQTHRDVRGSNLHARCVLILILVTHKRAIRLKLIWAIRLTRVFYSFTGKFHSDPHPGNLLVGPDGRTLSVIDFGQTKELDTDTRLGLARVILALAADERDAALSEIR